MQKIVVSFFFFAIIKESDSISGKEVRRSEENDFMSEISKAAVKGITGSPFRKRCA